MKWRCEICGRLREDEAISVATHDMSKDYGLDPGTMTRNIKYCNDSESCSGKAHIKPQRTNHAK